MNLRSRISEEVSREVDALVKRMQGQRADRAVDRLFEMSSEELGEAALHGAQAGGTVFRVDSPPDDRANTEAARTSDQG